MGGSWTTAVSGVLSGAEQLLAKAFYSSDCSLLGPLAVEGRLWLSYSCFLPLLLVVFIGSWLLQIQVQSIICHENPGKSLSCGPYRLAFFFFMFRVLLCLFYRQYAGMFIVSSRQNPSVMAFEGHFPRIIMRTLKCMRLTMLLSYCRYSVSLTKAPRNCGMILGGRSTFGSPWSL